MGPQLHFMANGWGKDYSKFILDLFTVCIIIWLIGSKMNHVWKTFQLKQNVSGNRKILGQFPGDCSSLVRREPDAHGAAVLLAAVELLLGLLGVGARLHAHEGEVLVAVEEHL